MTRSEDITLVIMDCACDPIKNQTRKSYSSQTIYLNQNLTAPLSFLRRNLQNKIPLQYIWMSFFVKIIF